MARQIVEYRGTRLRLYSCRADPQLAAPRVLGTDPWQYVELWLRREGDKDARFYWSQARAFYRASSGLDPTASPLTSYYCMLNAAKALLKSRGVTFSDGHGVSGKTEKGGAKKHSLAQEQIKFHGAGVLASLCNYLGDPIQPNDSLTLADALRHLPFLHRAYILTYPSADELFLPLRGHGFMRDPKTHETWFFGELPSKYVTRNLAASLPPGFEIDTHMPANLKSKATGAVIRRKKRFDWNGKALAASVAQFKSYHAALRQHLEPIFAPETRWYLRIKVTTPGTPDKSSMPLMFAAMHKLSELSRYDPLRLNEHLESRHNWLVAEFLSVAPSQFVHGVASEITGREFLRPDAFRVERSSP
jgi:YaaC-like Protein